MLELSIEYFSLIFMAAMGVLQAAAGHGERTRFFFFKRKIQGYFFAFLTVTPAMAALFTWNYRNPTGMIEGTQQFFLFLFATAYAMLVSVLIARLTASAFLIPGEELFKNSAKRLYSAKNYQDDRGI